MVHQALLREAESGLGDDGIEIGPGRHQHTRARALEQLRDVVLGQAGVDRDGDSGSLGGQGRGDELLAVGREQGHGVLAADPDFSQQVRYPVHIGEELSERQLDGFLPALGVPQLLPPPSDPARAGRLGTAARTSMPEVRVRRGGSSRCRRCHLGSSTAAREACRSPGVPHHRALATQVDLPVVGADGDLDDVTALEVLSDCGPGP